MRPGPRRRCCHLTAAEADIVAAEIDLNPALVAAAGNANNGRRDVGLQPCRQGFRLPGRRRDADAELRHHGQHQLRGPIRKSRSRPSPITIFGTNDTPVIATTSDPADRVRGRHGDSGGTLTVLHGEATGGTYDFKDPDLTDTHWIIDPNKDPAINPNANPSGLPPL